MSVGGGEGEGGGNGETWDEFEQRIKQWYDNELRKELSKYEVNQGEWYGNGSSDKWSSYGGRWYYNNIPVNEEVNMNNIDWAPSQNDMIIDDTIPYTTVANIEQAYEEIQQDYEPSPTSPQLTEQSTENYESFTSSINSINSINAKNSNSIREDMFLKKIKNDNKNIENVALGFVSLIILLFLLVIFNSIRNNLGKK